MDLRQLLEFSYFQDGVMKKLMMVASSDLLCHFDCHCLPAMVISDFRLEFANTFIRVYISLLNDNLTAYSQEKDKPKIYFKIINPRYHNSNLISNCNAKGYQLTDYFYSLAKHWGIKEAETFDLATIKNENKILIIDVKGINRFTYSINPKTTAEEIVDNLEKKTNRKIVLKDEREAELVGNLWNYFNDKEMAIVVY